MIREEISNFLFQLSTGARSGSTPSPVHLPSPREKQNPLVIADPSRSCASGQEPLVGEHYDSGALLYIADNSFLADCDIFAPLAPVDGSCASTSTTCSDSDSGFFTDISQTRMMSPTRPESRSTGSAVVDVAAGTFRVKLSASGANPMMRATVRGPVAVSKRADCTPTAPLLALVTHAGPVKRADDGSRVQLGPTIELRLPVTLHNVVVSGTSPDDEQRYLVPSLGAGEEPPGPNSQQQTLLSSRIGSSSGVGLPSTTDYRSQFVGTHHCRGRDLGFGQNGSAVSTDTHTLLETSSGSQIGYSGMSGYSALSSQPSGGDVDMTGVLAIAEATLSEIKAEWTWSVTRVEEQLLVAELPRHSVALHIIDPASGRLGNVIAAGSCQLIEARRQSDGPDRLQSSAVTQVEHSALKQSTAA